MSLPATEKRRLALATKVVHRDHMIASVRETKAKLSELISKATSGEEVVISVRGRPTIKLVPIHPHSEKPDIQSWANRRRSQLKAMPEKADSAKEIVSALRGERF